MSMCVEHRDFGGEIDTYQCPDCLIRDYRNIVDRIRSARNLRDWDEVNIAVRELCEMESEFRR